jgi:HNH endonuclease
MNICPRCQKEFTGRKDKVYCTEHCRKKMEEKRNRIKTAPIRQKKYEEYLQKQIPIWNAARIARLEAAAARRLVLAHRVRLREEARREKAARFRANPLRVSSTVIERLRAMSMPEPNTGCLLWLGEVHDSGYGRISIGGRMRFVHRVAYAAWISALPGGQRVLHRCDQPTCVNPEHLYAGTAKDNIDDAMRRGRLKLVRINGRFAKRD